MPILHIIILSNNLFLNFLKKNIQVVSFDDNNNNNNNNINKHISQKKKKKRGLPNTQNNII
jgi:hypothetical protein